MTMCTASSWQGTGFWAVSLNTFVVCCADVTSCDTAHTWLTSWRQQCLPAVWCAFLLQYEILEELYSRSRIYQSLIHCVSSDDNVYFKENISFYFYFWPCDWNSITLLKINYTLCIYFINFFFFFLQNINPILSWIYILRQKCFEETNDQKWMGIGEKNICISPPFWQLK